MAKTVVAGLTIFALLAPSALTALVWTPINLLVAISAVSTFVLLAIYAPKLKWLGALFASLPIAIAPYPNWLWASNDRGWHFHVGYKLKHYPVEFLAFYLIVFVLFLGLFWAIRGQPKESV